jgi:putative peptidoglycan lipid II flippase
MLGLGTTAGVIVQWLALLPSLRASGSRLRWRWEPAHQAIKTVLRLSGYTLLIVISNQVALFVILTLAASRPGGVSAYTYAYAFFQAPYGVLAVSVMTAMQPRLARAWALTDIAGFLRGVAMGLRMVVVVMLLPTVALLVLGKPLAGLVLAHGATGAAGAKTAGAALVWLGLGLPGFSAYLYLVRCYQAMQDLRTPFWLYVVENGINVGAGYALYQAAGVAGLAASLSLAYTVAAVLGAIRLRTQVGRIGIRALVTSLQRLALPLAAFVVVALAVQRPIPSGGTRWLLVRVVVAVVAGTAAFAVVAGVGAHAHDRRRVMPRRAVSAD